MPQIVGFKIQTIGKCTFLVLTAYFGANYRLLLFVRMSVNPLILFLDDDRGMDVKLLEANPLAEEIRNQVVVKRGPLVYCLESMDIEGGHKIDNVLIPADIRLTPKKITIEGSPIVALDGTARLVDEVSWKDTLYREVGKVDKPVHIRLIPYYAWGNRGKAEMTVWMPLARTNH